MSWIQLAMVLCAAATEVFGKREFVEQRFFEPIYQDAKKKSDQNSLEFRRVTQLYSRNSNEHIRILPSRKVDAMGKDGDKYAKLVIESDTFGRVRIRGAATNFYLCIDKRNKLRARVRGRNKNNCIFREHYADNAFTEFTSVKYKKQYIAFNRRGLQRAGHKTRSGMKAVQFLERTPRDLQLYRGRKHRKNMANDHDGHKVCITIKNWKKWQKWLKWRRERRKLKVTKTHGTLVVDKVMKSARKRNGKKRINKNRKNTRGKGAATTTVVPTATRLPSISTATTSKRTTGRSSQTQKKSLTGSDKI